MAFKDHARAGPPAQSRFLVIDGGQAPDPARRSLGFEPISGPISRLTERVNRAILERDEDAGAKAHDALLEAEMPDVVELSAAAKAVIVLNCDDLASAVEQYERYLVASGLDRSTRIDGQSRAQLDHRVFLDVETQSGCILAMATVAGDHGYGLGIIEQAACYHTHCSALDILCIVEDLAAIAERYEVRQ